MSFAIVGTLFDSGDVDEVAYAVRHASDRGVVGVVDDLPDSAQAERDDRVLVLLQRPDRAAPQRDFKKRHLNWRAADDWASAAWRWPERSDR